MASGAGPRARGTDGSDHKYRQRVESHYTVMASARKRLHAASQLHAAHVVSTVAALTSGYMTSGELDVTAGFHIATAVASGMVGLKARASSKASVVGPVEAYSRQLSYQFFLCALSAALWSYVCLTAQAGADAPLHARMGILAQVFGAASDVRAWAPAGRARASPAPTPVGRG